MSRAGTHRWAMCESPGPACGAMSRLWRVQQGALPARPPTATLASTAAAATATTAAFTPLSPLSLPRR